MNILTRTNLSICNKHTELVLNPLAHASSAVLFRGWDCRRPSELNLLSQPNNFRPSKATGCFSPHLLLVPLVAGHPRDPRRQGGLRHVPLLEHHLQGPTKESSISTSQQHAQRREGDGEVTAKKRDANAAGNLRNEKNTHT